MSRVKVLVRDSVIAGVGSSFRVDVKDSARALAKSSVKALVREGVSARVASSVRVLLRDSCRA